MAKSGPRGTSLRGRLRPLLERDFGATADQAVQLLRGEDPEAVKKAFYNLRSEMKKEREKGGTPAPSTPAPAKPAPAASAPRFREEARTGTPGAGTSLVELVRQVQGPLGEVRGLASGHGGAAGLRDLLNRVDQLGGPQNVIALCDLLVELEGPAGGAKGKG